jgi:hypothetical protein
MKKDLQTAFPGCRIGEISKRTEERSKKWYIQGKQAYDPMLHTGKFQLCKTSSDRTLLILHVPMH